MLAPADVERRAAGSRALVLIGGACALIGFVAFASSEHAPASNLAPALSLYVPPAGLQTKPAAPQTKPAAPPTEPAAPQKVPAAMPSVMTPPRSPEAQMPATPEVPVASSSFMMPMQSPMVPVVMMPSPADSPGTQTGPQMFAGFFWGLASSFAVGFAITAKQMYDGVKSSDVSLDVGASSGRMGRAGFPTMTAAEGQAMGNEPVMGRRALVTGAGAALAAAPLAAFADGASSKAVLERARAIYGSRVARLVDASPETILEEKNSFTLFTTGAYRSAAMKPKQKELNALSQKAVAAAKAGDKAGANAAVKEFVKVGEIRVLDTIQGGSFNPKQRRNAGAPATAEIEAQMGTSAYALYKPLKDSK